MKEVMITSIGTSKEVSNNLTDIWEVKFKVTQTKPIKYELNGVLEWKGDPIIANIQMFIEKLTDEVKSKKIRRK